MQFPIISITILIPLISGIYIMLFITNSNQENKELYSKYVAILSSIFTLISSIYLIMNFSKANAEFQFVEYVPIIEAIGLTYHVGLDGISILFLLLTSLLTPICIIATINSITHRIKEYLIAILFLQSLVIGFFCSINLFLFYIFFEAMLIPMYLLIGCWGGENSIYAAFKFFLYTFFGSVIFLISLITIYVKVGSFDMIKLTSSFKTHIQLLPHWVWFGLLIGLAIKIPMIPFHTWLPDAHVQAPTAGSIILAGILLKVGGYGMLRLLIQIFPDASSEYSSLILYMSIIAIIYGALVAMAQTDMKKMIAYSSVSHMGYVSAGLFSYSNAGIEGAMFQMLSHGFISSGLFLVVGVLYDRMHTKSIDAYGGVAAKMPILSVFFMILMLGSVGLPGTSGFVGEFLVILSIFKYNIILTPFAALGVILGAIYMLSLYKKVMLGETVKAEVMKLSDLKSHEIIAFLPLIFLTIFTGIYPESLLSFFRLNIANILN